MKRDVIGCVFVLALAACTASAPPLIAPPSMRLHGTIVSSAPMTAVAFAGSVVNAIGPAPRQAQADASGAYEFADVTRGEYRVCVTMPSIEGDQACASMTLTSDDNLAPPLVVTPLGALHGRVIDENGKPLAGAWIGALGETPIAITDADGAYHLDHLHVGARTLYAVLAGYHLRLDQTATVQWDDDQVVADLTLTGAATPLVPLTGTIVLSGDDGDAVTKDLSALVIEIQPLNRTLLCDAQGHFSTLVPAGVYSMTITGPRRHYDVPRLLVGDGHTYVVEGDYRELGTLGLPIGYRLSDDAQWSHPDGTQLAVGMFGTTPQSRIELRTLPELDVRYSVPRLVTFGVIDDRFYTTRARADLSTIDLYAVDLTSFAETLSVPSFAAATGSAQLMWNTNGDLINLSTQQPILSIAHADEFSRPWITANGATATFAYLASGSLYPVTHRLELRQIVDGALIESIDDIDATATSFALGKRLFYFANQALYGSTGDGHGVKLVDKVGGARVLGDSLFALQYLDNTAAIYRPSDGLLLPFKQVTPMGEGFLTPIDGTKQAFRLNSAPAKIVTTLDFAWSTTPDDHYLLFGATPPNPQTDWSALVTATGEVAHLGTAWQVREAGGRFYSSVVDPVGGTTVRLRDTNGVDTQIADHVYGIVVSPNGTRMLITHGNYRLTVWSLSDKTEQEIGYGNVMNVAWWGEDAVEWTAQPVDNLQARGTFVTTLTN